jgi:solute carrier family 29 (equilibrative nucleoside transporter), member 1/2/3
VDGWYPVLLITTFNLFDFLGRTLPTTSARYTPGHTTLLVASLIRGVVLLVLFAVLSVLGASEPVFFVLTAVLGGTNGWGTAAIFTAAPRGLSPAAAQLAGNINVFVELSGLFVGAYMGWLWTL